MTGRWPLSGVLLAISLVDGGCAPVLVGGAATTASVAHDRRTTGSVIEDSTIGRNCVIRSSLVEGSEVADGSEVGPFAPLRAVRSGEQAR